MFNYKLSLSKLFVGVFFASIGLASCGGGGGGGTPVSCSSTGNTSAISLPNINAIPSRVSGVAPLSVFFDAAGTTATTTTRPFHDLQYTWTFGDPASGATWAYGSNAGNNSKNAATGAVAAHVFETHGTYTVGLTVTDGSNTVTNACTQITVQDPAVVFAGSDTNSVPNTICVAASTTPVAGSGGCPSGALALKQSDFATAVNSYALSGKQLLFKRGDTFGNGSTAVIAKTGPGIIGAYGTGANPIIQTAANITTLALSSKSTPGIGDWRIMDLEINGSNAGSANTGIAAQGTINQVLMLSMNIHNTHGGVAFDYIGLDYLNANGSPGHTIFDQITIADSSITTQTGGAGMTGVFLSANRYAMLGTLIDDTTAIEHVSRYPYLNKAIISNNILSRPASTKHALKLHAPTWCQNAGSSQANYQPVCNYATDAMPATGVLFTGNGSGYTQQVVISDNKFVSAAGSAITVNLAPQNSGFDERLKDVIFERNWLTASANTQYAVNIVGNEMTFRNNICDMTGASPYRDCFVATSAATTVPPAANIRVYNNTGYASDTSSASSPIALVATVAVTTNLTVVNNLMYAPNAPIVALIDGATGAGYLASSNSTDAQINNTSPLFTTASPLIPSDFKPAVGSYAIGSGKVVPVWSDFFQRAEPATRDIGAMIH